MIEPFRMCATGTNPALWRVRRDATFVERPELAHRLRERVGRGDLVLTLGAGDITHVGEELLELLK